MPWSIPEVRLHLYGKATARPGRKMGHLLLVNQPPADSLRLAEQILARLARGGRRESEGLWRAGCRCCPWGGASAGQDVLPRRDSLPTAHEPARVIYVMGHGWHTSLVVQRAELLTASGLSITTSRQGIYLEIAWGDKDFYQAREPTFALAIQAAVKSTGSVLHIVGFTLPPEAYFPTSDVFTVRLSLPGFAALSTFIHTTYKRDAQGRTISLGQGWYGDSTFYLAEGRYHLFNTCNNWLARALHVAGAPIDPASAMTAGNVLSQVRQFGTDSRAPTMPRLQ